MNQWVKLKIEIYTKVKGDGIDIESISAMMSEPIFNFKMAGGKVTRNGPIVLEKDIYLKEKDIGNQNILTVNNFIIKLADKPISF